MPLFSELFTKPRPDNRLEACLVDDRMHIQQGDHGPFVEKIQTALNRVKALPGGEDFGLKVDGVYGSRTAAAVKKYKSAAHRDIRQPWQTTPDDIVGKRTIQSLDGDMDALEKSIDILPDDGFICGAAAGAPWHDHSKCPTPPRVTGELYQGRAAHRATPLNPKGTGRKINIYGEGETDYLGFTDYATEEKYQNGRLMTQTLPANCASDIFIRSTEVSKATYAEIKRIALPPSRGGCRFTFSSNTRSYQTPLVYSIGRFIQHGLVQDPDHPDNTEEDYEFVIMEVVKFPYPG